MTIFAASWELQKAMVDCVVAIDGIAQYLGDPPRVHDKIPDRPSHPYIFVGEDEESDIAAEDVPGSLHTVALTVVSASAGFKESKIVAQMLRDALDEAVLAIAGFECGPLKWIQTSHRRHPDQATARASTVLFAVELRPNA